MEGRIGRFIERLKGRDFQPVIRDAMSSLSIDGIEEPTIIQISQRAEQILKSRSDNATIGNRKLYKALGGLRKNGEIERIKQVIPNESINFSGETYEYAYRRIEPPQKPK